MTSQPNSDMEARFRVLRNPDFFRLWVANGFRDAGAQVAGFALSVTAVVVLHATPLQVSLIFVCSRLGYLLIGLPAGVWVDRWSKKAVLIYADLAYVIALAGIPITYLLDVLSVAQLVAAALVLSVAGVFFDVAHSSILPLLLPKRAIADANARLQTADNTIQAVSPGVAGALTQAVAAPLLYSFAALCHLWSVLLVSRMRVVAVDEGRRAERNFRREIVDGLRLLLNQPLLRLLMSQAALINVGAGIFLSMLPILLLDQVGVSAWVFGLLSSAGALSGVAASLVGPLLRRRFGEIRMTVLFAALAPVAVVSAPLATVWDSAAVPLLAFAEISISFVIVGRSVAAAGLRARVTAVGFLGRVSAANSVVTRGATPLGGIIAGLAANWWSISAALWLGVLAMTGPVILLANSPLRTLRELPADWEV